MGVRRGVHAREGCHVTATSESPCRVVQVIAGLDPAAGGPPAAAVATALALRGCGIANSLAYADIPMSEATAANAELLRSAGVEIHRFPVTATTGMAGVRWGISLRLAVWLLRNAHRFDVLHMHGAWTFTTAAGLVTARLRRRVAVLSTHESLTNFDLSKSGPITRFAKRVLRGTYLALFDLVVVSSPLEQRDSGDPGGRRTTVIPHAVRTVERSAPSIRKPGLLRVGFLGRLHPKKNLPRLIEAVASLDGDVTLVVAGNGPRRYTEQLRRLSLKVGIADHVTWLGFIGVDEKSDFLSSIDVLAMPSAYECFGVAAVEAMSAAVPVIVTPTVGISDAVARHGAGVVALPDREMLSAAVERFAVDQAFLERASAAALLAAAEFSLHRHGASLLREYLRLLSPGDKPSPTTEEVTLREQSEAVDA
jgi:glycosyltransferase involved in cell wall biosynthesis